MKAVQHSELNRRHHQFHSGSLIGYIINYQLNLSKTTSRPSGSREGCMYMYATTSCKDWIISYLTFIFFQFHPSPGIFTKVTNWQQDHLSSFEGNQVYYIHRYFKTLYPSIESCSQHMVHIWGELLLCRKPSIQYNFLHEYIF